MESNDSSWRDVLTFESNCNLNFPPTNIMIQIVDSSIMYLLPFSCVMLTHIHQRAIFYIWQVWLTNQSGYAICMIKNWYQLTANGNPVSVSHLELRAFTYHISNCHSLQLFCCNSIISQFVTIKLSKNCRRKCNFDVTLLFSYKKTIPWSNDLIECTIS